MEKIKRKISRKHFLKKKDVGSKLYFSNRKHCYKFPKINRKDEYILFYKPSNNIDEEKFLFNRTNGGDLKLNDKDFKYLDIYELVEQKRR